MNALRHLLLRCLQLGLVLLACALANLIVHGPARADGVVGLHLVSGHSRPFFEAANPGLYVKRDDGLTAGLLRNSYGRASVYAGWTLETADGRLAVTVGAITGYPARDVSRWWRPACACRWPRAGGARLSVLPKPPQTGAAAALHLSIERAF